MDYLGYIQTWIWIWGIVSTSTVAVAIWAAITRLPGVVVFVLAVGTGVMCLIGLETALITYTKIKELLGSRYRRALARLDDFRTEGVVLRNRLVQSDAEVRAFVDDLDAFETKALAAMRGAATVTDISWFRDLHEWTGPVVAGHKDEHSRMRAILDEKLRRMFVIASKIEERDSLRRTIRESE